MKKLLLISIIIFFAICSRSWAEANCSGSDTSKWDNCIGTKEWPSGSSYTGEWSKGKRQGQGTHYHYNGDIDEGIWKDNRCLDCRRNIEVPTAEEINNNPGFRNIKPGMTSEEIWNEAGCRINNRWNPCYGINNLKFMGRYHGKYLRVLYVDVGPIVDTYSLLKTFTEIMGEEPSNIYEKTLQALNKKYTRDYSYNERDRQLFNENMLNQLLVVFNKGQVTLKIFRKKVNEYSKELWLYVEYRNIEVGKTFMESNRPTRETSDDF